MSYEFVGEDMVAVEDTPGEGPVESPLEGSEDTKQTVLPEMTVTASPLDETSYNVQNATTATKTDTPIFDTPVSIQVVPQQVLRDQQAVTLDDVLKNVSGVRHLSISSGTTQDNFIIRGF